MNLFGLIQRQAYFEWNTLDRAKTVWKRVVDFPDAHFPIIRKIIAVEKEMPCFEDFNLKSGTSRHSRAYYDFLRKWHHMQNKHPIMLTDRIPHRLGIWTNSADYRINWE